VNITFSPIAFSKDNRQIYWLAGGPETDLGQLIVHDFDHPSQIQVLYKAVRTAIADVVFHPIDKTILLVTEYFHKPELYVANQTILDDVQHLVNLRPHASPIITNSMDFNTWLVSYNADNQPPEYFVYDRTTKSARYLFAAKPELAGKQMNRMIGFDFESRDGLKLQAYLSLPPKVSITQTEIKFTPCIINVLRPHCSSPIKFKMWMK
jgi:dipeptidyl aminopeptidase/acylaminoacyl peptidase